MLCAISNKLLLLTIDRAAITMFISDTQTEMALSPTTNLGCLTWAEIKSDLHNIMRQLSIFFKDGFS